VIIAAIKAAGFPPERLAAALAALKGKELTSHKTEEVLVRQARVCEMLDCSRFHVRKLVKEGLLPQRDIAGLRRYAVADIFKLAGGGRE
jgi:hypothetical protein